jgi:hypothetical protein
VLRTLGIIGIGLGIAAASVPVAAQVVCRPNALGTSICMGAPPAAPIGSIQRSPPLQRIERGRVVVGPAGGPTLAPARRTDALGTTILEPGDLPPRRSSPVMAPTATCRPDALGNLICR